MGARLRNFAGLYVCIHGIYAYRISQIYIHVHVHDISLALNRERQYDETECNDTCTCIITFMYYNYVLKIIVICALKFASSELCDGCPWSVECAGPSWPHHAPQQVYTRYIRIAHVIS